MTEQYKTKEKYEQNRAAMIDVTEFLQENSGLLLDNMATKIPVMYGKVSQNLPIGEVLRYYMTDGEIEARIALKKFVELHKDEKHKPSSALAVIFRLIEIDNSLREGENREIYREYTRVCTGEMNKVKNQVILEQTEALNAVPKRRR